MHAHSNPFRVEALHRLSIRVPGGNADQLWRHFVACRHRGAIVGPHGSGKSTLRRAIELRLQQEGTGVTALTLTTDRRRPPRGWWKTVRAERHDVLSVDGYDLLAPWYRLAILAARRGRGLLVVTHRWPPVPVLARMSTTTDLLAGLVAELVPGGVDRQVLDALFARHHGNIRECLFDLYDSWAAEPVAPYGVGAASCSMRARCSSISSRGINRSATITSAGTMMTSSS